MKLFLTVTLTWFAVVGGGCANQLVLPPTIQLSRSDYKKTDFPFMLTVEASDHIRFNVHTLSPAHANVPTEFFVFLKKESGTLTTGDFFIGSIGTYAPMATRGTLSFDGDHLVIDAEIARGNDPAKGWQPSSVNGSYRVIKAK